MLLAEWFQAAATALLRHKAAVANIGENLLINFVA